MALSFRQVPLPQSMLNSSQNVRVGVGEREGEGISVVDIEGDVLDGEGDCSVGDDEGDCSVGDDEGDGSVGDDEGDSSVGDGEGDSSVGDDEGDSSVGDGEVDSIVVAVSTT